MFYHETQEVRQVISESTSDKVRGILESVGDIAAADIGARGNIIGAGGGALGGIVHHQHRQVISESTSDKVRGILESVVANGSGHNASMNGYRIGGKTHLMGDDIACTHGAALQPRTLDRRFGHRQLLAHHVGHGGVRRRQLVAGILVVELTPCQAAFYEGCCRAVVVENFDPPAQRTLSGCAAARWALSGRSDITVVGQRRSAPPAASVP